MEKRLEKIKPGNRKKILSTKKNSKVWKTKNKNTEIEMEKH